MTHPECPLCPPGWPWGDYGQHTERGHEGILYMPGGAFRPDVTRPYFLDELTRPS